MINNYTVIKCFEHADKERQRGPYVLSEDHENILKSDTGEVVCSVDTMVDILRSEYHCNFESIYYEHASLTDVYRCRDCGTVIFGGDDSERYNPDERCPTCCNDESVCHNIYWTREQIDSDPEKQKAIEGLIQAQKEMNEAAKRRKARGGLYDWERWRKRIHLVRHIVQLTSICYGYGDKNRTKDRFLEIVSFKKSTGIRCHRLEIPLTWYHFYIKHIYRYTRKCSPVLRKYLPWQKKPEEV